MAFPSDVLAFPHFFSPFLFSFLFLISEPYVTEDELKLMLRGAELSGAIEEEEQVMQWLTVVLFLWVIGGSDYYFVMMELYINKNF
jgi:hypothetical protein